MQYSIVYDIFGRKHPNSPMKWHLPVNVLRVQRRIHPLPPFTCSLARSHTDIGTLQPVSVSVRAFRNGQRGLTNSVRSETRARSLSNKPAERHRHTFQTIFKVNEFQFRGEIQSE